MPSFGPNALVEAHRSRVRASAIPEVETSYHAASTQAKDMASWNPQRVSPDSALLSELDTIVARSEDLTRNNGIASGARRTLIDNVVGARVMLKPNPNRIALDKSPEWVADWSQTVESSWSSFADVDWFDVGLRHNFHSAARLAFGTVFNSGEMLALPLWTSHTGSKWNTCMQFVAPARLSNPNNRGDTAKLRGGIELDDFGAAVAYHIRKSDPGDFFFGTRSNFGEWERVPAYTPWGRARVVHFYDPEDIGQTRGKPFIATIMRQFKMVDHYHREKLRQAVLNSMIFASLETPLDQETMVEMLGGDAAKDYVKKLDEWRVQMKGGTIVKTPPGTTMKSFVPNSPDAGIDAFTTVMLRHIAAGLNLPYELVAKDFTKSNYSSARAALIEAWRYFLACRQLLADKWWGSIYDLWFEEAVGRGEIPDCKPKDFYKNRTAWTKAKWITSGRGWVDPVKEADAAKIRMDAGLSTLEDECAEQGKDWRDVSEQRARERTFNQGLGLPDPQAVQPGQQYPSDQPNPQPAPAREPEPA